MPPDIAAALISFRHAFSLAQSYDTLPLFYFSCCRFAIDLFPMLALLFRRH